VTERVAERNALRELAARLKLLGVDFVQGFLMHRPNPIVNYCPLR
jgi:EAL domain-containing protein (putative c-di-GMP-specific phosphodiesterase class I)